MFGINDIVYYGRTWDEFKEFINRLHNNTPELKVIFIHNLAFEFQYLKSIFHYDEVAARISHKPMKAHCNEFNFEMRCSYMMSNCSLARLPKLFNLPIEKKVGDLDYKLLRHSKTKLTKKELKKVKRIFRNKTKEWLHLTIKTKDKEIKKIREFKPVKSEQLDGKVIVDICFMDGSTINSIELVETIIENVEKGKLLINK